MKKGETMLSKIHRLAGTLTVLVLALTTALVFAQDAEQPAVDSADKAAQDAGGKVDQATDGTTPPAATPDQPKAADPATTPATVTADSQVGQTYNDGKNTYATSQAKFELTATDTVSSLDYVEYRLDEATNYSGYTQPFSIEKEGPHRIVYRSVDKVGNREEENTFNVIIDNTGPALNFALNKSPIVIEGRRYLAPGTKLEIRAIDNYSGVKSIEYSIGGGEFQPYKDGIILDKVGAAQFKYRATDNLGNKSESVSGQGATPEDLMLINSLYVENTAPAVSINPTKRWINVNDKKYALRDNSYTVDAFDNESGLANIFVKVDTAAEWQIYSGKLVFQTEGPHSIEAKAIDKVGNESQPVKIEFIVDDNPPKTTIRPIGAAAK